MKVGEIDGLMIKPSEIDNEGYWHVTEPTKGKINLLGKHLPVPEEVRLEGEPVKQEVMMILPMKEMFDACPECGEACDDNIVLSTLWAKMIPAKCCNMILWVREEEDNEFAEQYA